VPLLPKIGPQVKDGWDNILGTISSQLLIRSAEVGFGSDIVVGGAFYGLFGLEGSFNLTQAGWWMADTVSRVTDSDAVHFIREIYRNDL